MCAVALTLGLLVATCEPIDLPNLELRLPEQQASVAVRRLTNPELSRIRGTGGGYSLKTGRDGVTHIIQDSNTRDMMLTAPVTTQVMDAWWGEVGVALAATGALQR